MCGSAVSLPPLPPRNRIAKIMRIVASFPREVLVRENVFIPMSDGSRLAARTWLLADADRAPVPAILEYLPYRKADRNAGTGRADAPCFHARVSGGFSREPARSSESTSSPLAPLYRLLLASTLPKRGLPGSRKSGHSKWTWLNALEDSYRSHFPDGNTMLGPPARAGGRSANRALRIDVGPVYRSWSNPSTP